MNRFTGWLRRAADKRIIAVCLGAVLCAAVALSIRSVRGDVSLRGMDTGNHLVFSVEYFYLFEDMISNPSLNLFEKTARGVMLLGEELEQEGRKHSNFVYFTTSVAYLLFGQSLYVAKMSMLLYVGILLVSVFLLAKTLTGSRTAGIAAACILYLCPLIFESSRQYGVDLPLTAMVALSLYVLLRHRGFLNRGLTVALAVVAGIGVQVKPQFVLYFALPFAVVVAEALIAAARKRSAPDLSRILVNLCIFLVIAGAITSIWLLPRTGCLWRSFLFHRNPYGIAGNVPVLKRLSSNVSQLAFFALGLPVFSVFLISAVSFWSRGSFVRLVYAVWIGFPFYLFSVVFMYSTQRYFMPFLPALAAITAWYLFTVRAAAARVSALVLLIGFLCLQFGVLTLGNSRVRADMVKSIAADSERLIRTTLQTPYAFLGWTQYGDTTMPEGYREVSGLLESFDGKISPDRVNFLLQITMTPEGFQPKFDIRYYFQSRYRRVEWLDLTDMPDKVSWVMENSGFDYIIMRMPYGYAARWPEQEEFDRMLAGGMNDSEAIFFDSHRYRKNLLDAMHEIRAQYALETVIPVDRRYQWAVFSRQRRDAGPVTDAAKKAFTT